MSYREVVFNKLLPESLSIGVPYKLFWHLTPKKLKAFSEAYKIQRNIDDEKAYMNGIYTLKALEVALSGFAAGLSGKQSKAKYFDKPLLKVATEQEKAENLQNQRELFVAKLLTMQTNFELNHLNGVKKNVTNTEKSDGGKSDSKIE